ncbi:unnamed protein product [Brassica napus]|uniref:(rape) hypothetical protein n=1 Tax=Brassica napus TaxID=3708 RepID=A0A816KGX2_BRANA|nr:unnamed protein product [Brassica napus]
MLINSFARPEFFEFFKQVESIGTMLSIDWKDVGAMKIESTLHNDLALKT